MLEDEDFAQLIQLHLQEIAKDGYIRALDIVDFLAQPEMQQKLEEAGAKKRTISLRTAQHWLHNMGWRYARKKNGMYIDGHERPDIVDYREAFIERWKGYEKRMASFDNDGEREAFSPHGFPVPPNQVFKLILVTHDESIFYENDRRKNCWTHKSDRGAPQRKGEGSSLMVSDFLTTEWGRLTHDNESVNFYHQVSYKLINTSGRQESSSNPGTIVMAILQLKISFDELTMRSTFLKGEPMVSQRDCSCSITLQAIRNALTTLYQPGK